MATLRPVMGFIMLAVLLGACHAESSVEATDVTLPTTTTTTTSSTTSTSITADSDVVNVSEKETVVAATDMHTAVSNASSLPPVEDKGVDDKLPSSSPSPSTSTVGDKQKEGEDKEGKKDREDKEDKKDREDKDKEEKKDREDKDKDDKKDREDKEDKKDREDKEDKKVREDKDKEDKQDKHREETDKEKKEKGEPLEVDDMLKDPYRNKTVEDSTTAQPDKETVTVVDSHVVDSKKTHEEEEAENKTTTSPPPTRITDQPVSQVFFSESTIATPVLALVVDHSNHEHLSPGKTSPFAQPTATAAILAGVLVGVAVAGYVGLVSWRKFLEKRYGNREMLVNEDDDMHHFEL